MKPGDIWRAWRDAQFREDMARNIEGVTEAGLSVLTGAGADAVGGLRAMGAAMVGHSNPRAYVDQAREQYTYQPRTQEGNDYLVGIGRGIEAGVDKLKQVPGADTVEQGWYDFSAKQPMLAAVGMGAIETLTPGGRARRAGVTAAELAARRARPTTVNIGLKVGESGSITPEEALAALKAKGVNVEHFDIARSGTEKTLVAKLDRPLTPEEGHALSVELKQEAIAQRAGDEGSLMGPSAEKWGPFDPNEFRDVPQKTRKAYKLFRVDPKRPGELFPLFVRADEPVPIGEWVKAKSGEREGAGVKSKIGKLAYRPGWHAGDIPQARHIGMDRIDGKPTARRPDQVWAEVELADDVDWQSVADSRAGVIKSGPNKGKLNARQAQIDDQVPYGGSYRYKTNSNMEGDWLISGDMKVNRVLSDSEVEFLNSQVGRSDLPRKQPWDAEKFGFDQPTPVELENADVRAFAADEPDVARSLIAGRKKDPVTTDTAVEAMRARRQYRQEPNTTPGPLASDAEWSGFGAAHGVNLDVTPPVEVAPGVAIPGGLDGTFSIADLFEMKSLNIDPSKLPRDVHDALMQKIVRTYDVPNPDPVDVFNRLSFALLSPNAPLLPNEFLAQRLRATSMDDIRKLASREGQADLAKALDKESGVGAAKRGGMGVKGTADLSNLATLAKAVIEKPEMFRAGPGETLRDVALRVFNQVPGLGPKTASLGVPWLDLKNANVSAVDLHMVRNNYQRLLTDEKVGPQFVERMAKKLKTEPTVEAVQAAIKKAPKQAEKAAIAVIGGSGRSKQFRNKKGVLSKDLPESLSPDLLWREPEKAKFFNEFYDRVVDFVNESRGADPTIALFPEQWRLWDTYRGRFEPHEFAHPDWRKLPKQSFTEMQQAFLANKKAGFARKQGFSGKPHSQSWKKLYYGRADPKMLAGLAGVGALAAGGYSLLDDAVDDAKEKQKRRVNRTDDLLREIEQ